MRNILLALLLANILYFMYERFVEDPPELGIAVVEESALGPELQLSDPPTPTAADGEATAALVDAPESVQLAAMVGRSCVTVGPFRAASDAEGALGDFIADDYSAVLRSTDGQVFVGHWVQIRNIADRSSGNQMIETLREGGLGDAYLVETEDEGLKISLGLFGEMPRAERIELQAKSLGLPADIVPRMRDATVFFVDLGLPPGRGAGNIVEKYGEDKVLLRDQAVCPGSQP